MRKLIESALVSLDGVTGIPERWANFDAEDTELAHKQLGHCDAFVMGRVTYENFYANWGHTSGNAYIDLINAMPKYVASRSLTETRSERHPPRPRCSRRDRSAEKPARQGPHQVRDQPLRRHPRPSPPHRRVPLLDPARCRWRRTTAVRGVDTSSLQLKLIDQKGLHNGSVVLTYAPQ